MYSVNGVSQLSDGRLKTKIVPLPYGIDEVMKLRPVSYNWKNHPDSLPKMGLIAQEIYRVIPEVVEGSPNQEIPMSINYSEIVPLLVQAI